jgi:tRNA (guanine-N7-)-methyltransferase
MGRSLKYEIPGDDPRRRIDAIAAQGWPALFEAGPARDSIEAGEGVLEIGFGRGEFLLEMASASPERAFIGIEVSFKRTLKMARKVARAKLGNIRLIEAPAESVLRDLFPDVSLAEVWINFSDPWPKARHGHRRLIQSEFVGRVADLLAGARGGRGGTLFVATDDVPYAHQIDEVLAAEPQLVNRYAPWPFLPEVPGRMQTGYEEQWRAEGRPLHFFEYGSDSVNVLRNDEPEEGSR